MLGQVILGLAVLQVALGAGLQSFYSSRLVPDLLNEAPQENLQVVFKDAVVQQGNVLKPSLAKNIPKVQWNANPNEYYTIMMIDPDYPSKQNHIHAYAHWLVMNIPGNDIFNGQTIVKYEEPTPDKGTGQHRFVLLAFKQTGRLSVNLDQFKDQSLKGRSSFIMREFMKQFNMGTPFAGNFFFSEYEY